MVSSLRKLTNLSAREFFFLIISSITLPLVGLLLRFRGFRRTEKLLSRFSRAPRDEAMSEADVREIAGMVSLAATHGIYRAQCLPQAIALWWMLGLLGVLSTVRLGIYKTEGGVEAHAWVLYNDEIVIGELSMLDEYTPLLDVNIERPE